MIAIPPGRLASERKSFARVMTRSKASSNPSEPATTTEYEISLLSGETVEHTHLRQSARPSYVRKLRMVRYLKP